MKNYTVIACALMAALCFSCNKNSNTYSTTDHTVGMVDLRHWAGTSQGFALGDSVISGTSTPWPKHFYRTISDTSFAVQKINGFSINMLGYVLSYRSTDSVAKTVLYDSTVAGKLSAYLIYYFGHDSITFNVHRVDSFSTAASQYYQVIDSFHTK